MSQSQAKESIRCRKVLVRTECGEMAGIRAQRLYLEHLLDHEVLQVQWRNGRLPGGLPWTGQGLQWHEGPSQSEGGCETAGNRQGLLGLSIAGIETAGPGGSANLPQPGLGV